MKHDVENGLTAAGPGMPEATGSRRMAWAAMPHEATAEIERLLGSPVAEAISQPGGFSGAWPHECAWRTAEVCSSRRRAP